MKNCPVCKKEFLKDSDVLNLSVGQWDDELNAMFNIRYNATIHKTCTEKFLDKLDSISDKE